MSFFLLLLFCGYIIFWVISSREDWGKCLIIKLKLRFKWAEKCSCKITVVGTFCFFFIYSRVNNHTIAMTDWRLVDDVRRMSEDKSGERMFLRKVLIEFCRRFRKVIKIRFVKILQ